MCLQTARSGWILYLFDWKSGLTHSYKDKTSITFWLTAPCGVQQVQCSWQTSHAASQHLKLNVGSFYFELGGFCRFLFYFHGNYFGVFLLLMGAAVQKPFSTKAWKVFTWSARPGLSTVPLHLQPTLLSDPFWAVFCVLSCGEIHICTWSGLVLQLCTLSRQGWRAISPSAWPTRPGPP